MVQAVAGAGSALLSAFGNQTRRENKGDRPQYQSAIPALAGSDPKKFKKLQKEAREERLYTLLSQPEILGYIMALGGMVASQKIPFSGDPEANAMLRAVATTMSIAMGMGYAGVGDLTSLSVALGAGGASLFGAILDTGSIGEVLDTQVGEGTVRDAIKWNPYNPLGWIL